MDTETGGLTPGWHEVLEIAIVPLTDLYQPHPEIPAFHTTVRPEYPERVDLGALIANGRVRKDSPDKAVAMAEAMEKIMEYPTRKETVVAFVKWYNDYAKPEKLGWLCHNGNFDIPFLEHWFLPSHINGLGFRDFLNYQGRDTQRIAMWMQDNAKVRGVRLPLPGVSLTKITSFYGINHTEAHTALGDALATAEVYRRFCGIGF